VGCGAGGVGAGDGEEDPEILKSKQEMKVSGGLVQIPLDHVTSSLLKVSVSLPTLLTSRQVFPVFQRSRPIPAPPGHEKDEGTWYFVSMKPPELCGGHE